MDKACVTKRVKKHPIILRAAFLPGKICNASDNGGGVLVGYMPVVSVNFKHTYMLCSITYDTKD
jgi:hypothetical protein